jgi:hypothetical protein
MMAELRPHNVAIAARIAPRCRMTLFNVDIQKKSPAQGRAFTQSIEAEIN